MRVNELANFIKAREHARIIKEKGFRSSEELDPIIAEYRFCNVRREDDRVTKFVRKWCKEFARSPDQWFCFVVARLFNNEDTLNTVADCLLPHFKPERMRRALRIRRNGGLKNFNAAYIVSTNGVAMDKVDYVIDRILAPLWRDRASLRAAKFKSLAAWHEALTQYQGLGSFLAAQVIADAKYEPPFWDHAYELPTSHVEDWYTFAASGPGSRRGLNRVMGYDVNGSWKEHMWRAQITELRSAIIPLLPQYLGSYFHAQDLQNCLCEFDKYERARLGEGRPKQKYVPHNEEN